MTESSSAVCQVNRTGMECLCSSEAFRIGSMSSRHRISVCQWILVRLEDAIWQVGYFVNDFECVHF